MRYSIELTGLSAIIHNNLAAGLDTRSELSRAIAEIAKKKGSNRTIEDDATLQLLEAERSLWLNGDGMPHISAAAVRSCIETAARKLKQGPQVREGLVVEDTVFHFDREFYGNDIKTIARMAKFTAPVKVQRRGVLRTRALFNPPWSVQSTVDADDDLVDKMQLETWLGIAGRRIGLGDWRPEKSGSHGRFTAEVKRIES